MPRPMRSPSSSDVSGATPHPPQTAIILSAQASAVQRGHKKLASPGGSSNLQVYGDPERFMNITITGDELATILGRGRCRQSPLNGARPIDRPIDFTLLWRRALAVDRFDGVPVNR